MRTYASGSQAADDTADVIKFDEEDFDLGSDFDTSTYRFTAPRTGYYQINASIRARFFSSSGDSLRVAVWKNGADELTRNKVYGANTAYEHILSLSDIQYLNANDYLDLRTIMNGGGTATIGGQDPAADHPYTFLSVAQLL